MYFDVDVFDEGYLPQASKQVRLLVLFVGMMVEECVDPACSVGLMVKPKPLAPQPWDVGPLLRSLVRGNVLSELLYVSHRLMLAEIDVELGCEDNGFDDVSSRGSGEEVLDSFYLGPES